MIHRRPDDGEPRQRAAEAAPPSLGATLSATLCTPMENLTPEALAQVADYFQALAEPTRLRIINLLRHEPRSVGELALETGYSVANVSRHLALLAQRGLLARETHGTSVHYRIADPAIYELCDLVCGNLGRRFEKTQAQRAAFAAVARPRRRGAGR